MIYNYVLQKNLTILLMAIISAKETYSNREKRERKVLSICINYTVNCSWNGATIWKTGSHKEYTPPPPMVYCSNRLGNGFVPGCLRHSEELRIVWSSVSRHHNAWPDTKTRNSKSLFLDCPSVTHIPVVVYSSKHLMLYEGRKKYQWGACFEVIFYNYMKTYKKSWPK